MWLFAGSVPEGTPAGIANTMPVYDPNGQLVGAHRKAHLYPTSHEPDIFIAGSNTTTVDTPWGRVGLSICFDGDHAGWAARLRKNGADVVVHAAAYESDAASWWDLLYPAHALTNAQWWLMCNQAGGDCFGRSRVVDPLGRVLAEAPEAADTLMDFRLDLDAGRRLAHVATRALQLGARPELY